MRLLRRAPKRPYCHCWCGLMHFEPRHDTPRWLKRMTGRTILPPSVRCVS